MSETAILKVGDKIVLEIAWLGDRDKAAKNIKDLEGLFARYSIDIIATIETVGAKANVLAIIR